MRQPGFPITLLGGVGGRTAVDRRRKPLGGLRGARRPRDDDDALGVVRAAVGSVGGIGRLIGGAISDSGGAAS